MKDLKKENVYLRPPIVVVLGHVDHGKTTLLDALRKTDVAAKEAGGITQSIGASQVTTREGKVVTFIDTPGHYTFAKMRSRGAKVADIAVLVIASEDGVKPQTEEALKYIKEAGIPMIVVATKSDLASANPEMLRSQLTKLGINLEKSGGDTPFISVSARKGQGIEELLETITLLSEVSEIKGDVNSNLDAVIIETGKDKRGTIISLIVKDGILSVGDEIATDTSKAKVRGIFNYLGKQVKSIKPGEPGQVLGFSEPPQVGSRVWNIKNKDILPITSKAKPLKIKETDEKVSLVLKASNAGILEAILENLSKDVFVVSATVGDVNESDIFIAKSSGSRIFAFESKIGGSASRLADTEGVLIENFTIIYELFERMDKIIDDGNVKVLGKAQIIQIFPYENKKVAGCRAISGEIAKNDDALVSRDNKEVGKVKIVSMKKGKREIEKVKQGEEVGGILGAQLEFKRGDVLSSVRNA